MTKMPGRCPNCGSSNIQAEPLYLYDYDDEYDFGYHDDEKGDLAVFCVSCGHYLGEMQSELTARMQNYRQELTDWVRQVEVEKVDKVGKVEKGEKLEG